MIAWTRTSLGLDLGSESIKWVLLRAGLRSQVVSSGSIAVKSDLGEHLQELSRKLESRPGAVVATLPATRCYYQPLALPFRDPRKLQAVLPFELEPYLPRPLDGLSLDGLPNAEGCLAMALEPKEFAPLQEQLASAGLTARVLEPDLLPAARALLMSREAEASRTTVLIDLGHAKTGFAVIDRGQVSRLGAIRGGLATLVERLAEREGVSEEEARTRLRQRGLDAFPEPEATVRTVYGRLRSALRAGRKEAPQVVLCGGGAEVPGLAALIAGWLGAAEAEVLAPDGLNPSLAAAWGAAQRGLSRNVPCSVRLLSAEPESLPFWTRPRRRVAAALAVVALGLGAVDLVQQKSNRREELARLDQQIERLFRSVVPDATRVVDAPHQLRQRLEEMERRSALVMDPSRDPTHPLAVLSAISAAVPPELRLDIFGYTQTDKSLQLNGEIDNIGAVSALQAALSRLPFVERVNLGTTRKSIHGDRVGFEMDVVLQGGVAEAAP